MTLMTRLPGEVQGSVTSHRVKLMLAQTKRHMCHGVIHGPNVIDPDPVSACPWIGSRGPDLNRGRGVVSAHSEGSPPTFSTAGAMHKQEAPEKGTYSTPPQLVRVRNRPRCPHYRQASMTQPPSSASEAGTKMGHGLPDAISGWRGSSSGPPFSSRTRSISRSTRAAES